MNKQKKQRKKENKKKKSMIEKNFKLSNNININLSAFESNKGSIKIDKSALLEYQNSLKLLFGLNDLTFIKIASQEMDIDLMENLANRWREKFDQVVILGTGGSSLGGQALYNLLHPGFNLPINKEKKEYPELFFIDNIDPETFDFMFKNLDMKKTGFISISKSGSTIETLSQTLVIAEKIKADKLNIKDHLLIITEDKDSPLSKICKEFNLDHLVHDPKIGGRFSVFSNVALFPVMIAGADVRKIRKSAYKIFEDIANKTDHPALLSTFIVAKDFLANGINQSVLFTYCDKLCKFGQWYRQLVGESLGKANKGITPIHSIGTVDQHSQLQLYLDGPKDKFFTMIGYESNGVGDKINDNLKAQPILKSKTLGDVLFAEFMATADSIAEKNLPIRSFILKKVDEETVGELLMYFMIETVLLSFAMEINAFDQPAVERSKILTKEYLCKT